MGERTPVQGSLRKKILTGVGALVVLSLLGSTLSLYRIADVNRELDSINRFQVPLARLLTQMRSDMVILQREAERGLGYSQWSAPGFQPRPLPTWIREVVRTEVEQATSMLRAAPRVTGDAYAPLRAWSDRVGPELGRVLSGAEQLQQWLERGKREEAAPFYPEWNEKMTGMVREVEWASTEADRMMRASFNRSEEQVEELEAGLQMILLVVVSLSFLLFWFGERALRPLAQLTQVARDITDRGLIKGDKARLPPVVAGAMDEVSELQREFHRMATVLLEREKTIQQQKKVLEESNDRLRVLGLLNRDILNSIESALVVVGADEKIAQLNAVAARWLAVWKHPGQWIGQRWDESPALRLIGAQNRESSALEVCFEGRYYRAQWLDLKGSAPAGRILAIEEVTSQVEIEQRLRSAENLATVGRMSAQVAHEVRNPLHSIGLEAELALSTVNEPVKVKASLQSILQAVERLNSITENYLKFSRLSSGKRKRIDLSEVFDHVIAAYAPVCEQQQVRVDWQRLSTKPLWVLGDGAALEQALGNLFGNALQALAQSEKELNRAPEIVWRLGHTSLGQVFVRIEDNGPGVAPDIREQLFTPFVTTKASGTGLGLSFVKRVAEEHEGTVRLIEASESRGGAAFEVLLPSAVAEVPTGVML